MRLIDADALKREITDSGEDCTIANYVRHVLRETLDNVPTIDAVPVVRCRDCKYFICKTVWGEFGGVPIIGADDAPICDKWGDGWCMTSPDGYCFMAEKRDDHEADRRGCAVSRVDHD